MMRRYEIHSQTAFAVLLFDHEGRFVHRDVFPTEAEAIRCGEDWAEPVVRRITEVPVDPPLD